MVIGMGPQLIAPGTFDIGAKFPLTGEATMQINPDTGTPYWYRNTPIEAVVPGNYFDVRDELTPQFPDWVVRRERKRREQLLLDTNASGAMRTALDFTPQYGIALPDGWQVTNMYGLGAHQEAKRVKTCKCPPSTACCKDRWHFRGKPIKCHCLKSSACCYIRKPLKPIVDYWPAPVVMSGLMGHLAMVSGMGGPTSAELASSAASVYGPGPLANPQNIYQEAYAKAINSGMPKGAAVQAATWEVEEAGFKRAPAGKQGAPAKTGGKIYIQGPTAEQRAALQAQLDAQQKQNVSREAQTQAELRSLGITSKATGITRVSGPCNADVVKRAQGVGLPSLSTRVWAFDDCYLIAEGGGIRQVARAGGGGGAAPAGPDYFSLYDAWLRSQPYGAQTRVKGAQWQGDDPSAPAVGPDWGGGDDTKFSFNFTGGQTPVIVQQMWPNETPNIPTMFTAGPGRSFPEGPLETLF
jgi:hypothetical protein